jgi:hypothetical protein
MPAHDPEDMPRTFQDAGDATEAVRGQPDDAWRYVSDDPYSQR